MPYLTEYDWHSKRHHLSLNWIWTPSCHFLNNTSNWCGILIIWGLSTRLSNSLSPIWILSLYQPTWLLKQGCTTLQSLIHLQMCLTSIFIRAWQPHFTIIWIPNPLHSYLVEKKKTKQFYAAKIVSSLVPLGTERWVFKWDFKFISLQPGSDLRQISCVSRLISNFQDLIWVGV